jgi:hypothetical protein
MTVAGSVFGFERCPCSTWMETLRLLRDVDTYRSVTFVTCSDFSDDNGEVYDSSSAIV